MKPVNITLTAENSRTGDFETLRYDFRTGWNTNLGDSADRSYWKCIAECNSVDHSIEDIMMMMMVMVMVMILMTYQQRSRRRIHTPLRNKWW